MTSQQFPLDAVVETDWACVSAAAFVASDTKDVNIHLQTVIIIVRYGCCFYCSVSHVTSIMSIVICFPSPRIVLPTAQTPPATRMRVLQIVL